MHALRPDQVEDLATLINNPKHIHGSEPGTGKTPTICTYQRYLSDYKDTGSVLIQPLSLIKKNYDEAIKWGGWDPKDLAIVTDNNPPTNKRLYLCNPERLGKTWDKLPEYVRAVQIDEAHKAYGSDSSARTQALYRFMKARKVEYFTPATGTLYRGKPDSTYPILSIIEPRYFGCLKSFQNRYHVVDPFTGDVTGYRNLDHLGKIIDRHQIRRTFESIFGRQEIVFQRDIVEMSSRQKELYDEFEAAALLELERFYVEGHEPGVAFIRARQILEHPERFPNLAADGDDFVDITPGEINGKLERLKHHLEDAKDAGEPLIIFAALRPQQDLIAQAARELGFRVGQINGSTSFAERSRISEQFTLGEIDCIVGSPACADVGFNWQMCGQKEVGHVIFVSLDYHDSTIEQAYRRAIRGKRNRPLRVTVMLYDCRVDWRTLQIVKDKSRDASLVDATRRPLDM
jgi:Helicase conserved C-terminal domain